MSTDESALSGAEPTAEGPGGPDPEVISPPPPKDADPTPLTSFTFSIWPPTRRTRDAVVARLVETLTAASPLTRRYPPLPADEAASAAHLIEEEAFSSATSTHEGRAAAAGSDDDAGMETLQFYSKEISKKMLNTVKTRGPSAAEAPPSADHAQPESPVPMPALDSASEEMSSIESETTQA